MGVATFYIINRARKINALLKKRVMGGLKKFNAWKKQKEEARAAGSKKFRIASKKVQSNSRFRTLFNNNPLNKKISEMKKHVLPKKKVKAITKGQDFNFTTHGRNKMSRKSNAHLRAQIIAEDEAKASKKMSRSAMNRLSAPKKPKKTNVGEEPIKPKVMLKSSAEGKNKKGAKGPSKKPSGTGEKKRAPLWAPKKRPVTPVIEEEKQGDNNVKDAQQVPSTIGGAPAKQSRVSKKKVEMKTDISSTKTVVWGKGNEVSDDIVNRKAELLKMQSLKEETKKKREVINRKSRRRIVLDEDELVDGVEVGVAPSLKTTMEKRSHRRMLIGDEEEDDRKKEKEEYLQVNPVGSEDLKKSAPVFNESVVDMVRAMQVREALLKQPVTESKFASSSSPDGPPVKWKRRMVQKDDEDEESLNSDAVGSSMSLDTAVNIKPKFKLNRNRKGRTDQPRKWKKRMIQKEEEEDE